MSKSTDERGRIYLPKAVRERFGDRYRIVELPSHVALFPVDDDPLEGLDAAVDGAFEGEDGTDLKADARASVSKQVRDDHPHRSSNDAS
jgi:bifunctional DNA-binding transcriptional regulator/antitoxin component of YhaV-PrlF toxin-antitoxin module